MGLASGRVSRVFGPLAIARLGQALSLRQSWEPGVQPSHNQKQQTKLATAQAQNDQRGTKESPVVVDVLSHPKSQEEAAQGKRAADRKKIPIAKRISQVPTDAKHNNFIGKVSPSKQLRPISDHGFSRYQRHFSVCNTAHSTDASAE